MAKDTKKNDKKGSSSSLFLIIGAALLVFVAYSTFLGYRLYAQLTDTYNSVQDSLTAVAAIKDDLLVVNRDVLMIVSETGSISDNVNEIENCFEKIDKNMEAYESVEDRDEKELRRYKQAKTFINAYHNKINQFQEQFLTDTDRFDVTTARAMYIQELHPLQITGLEMFDAAKDIGQTNSEKKLAEVNRMLYVFIALMCLILVAGEVAVFVIARTSKAQKEKLEKRERELEEFDKKLKVSKRQMSEMSLQNSITGLKNRYALEEEIGGKLQSDNMCIALLDLDDFRRINNNFGYEYGDEYLSMVANKLRETYESKAEVYNIQGNQFCMVFNSSVNGNEARGLADQALKVMSESYAVSNISLQLTARGCFFNYIAGDSSNLNKLLLDMNAALSDAKRNNNHSLVIIK